MNLFKFVTKLSYHRYLDWVPDKLYISIIYLLNEKKFLRWRNPVELNQKLQWLKVYDRNPAYTDMVDKFKVKDVVREKIGDEYVIPLLGVWDSPDEIDFSKLPDSFVLKTNNSSHDIILCKDKSSFDIEDAKRRLSKTLRASAFWFGREWPYKNVVPKIIAEPYLTNSDGSSISDYKFYCFGGKFKYICYCENEAIHHPSRFRFDMELNPIDELFIPINPKPVKLPENMDELIKVATKLSRGLNVVRIDLYDIDGRILFGEFTFFPGSGFIKLKSSEFSRSLADCIDMDNVWSKKHKKQ